MDTSCAISFAWFDIFVDMSNKKPRDHRASEANGKGKWQKLMCPTLKAGSVIGKGGDKISHIRQESGAKVSVEETIPGCNERVVVIVGSEEDNQLLNNQSKKVLPKDKLPACATSFDELIQCITLNALIFHVNGDDVEADVHACELVAEWRQTFHSDVVVDIICYRRFGHNEIDEPSFTQPKMYKVIRNHPSRLEIYQKKLLETGQATKEEIDRIQNKVTSILNDEFLASKDYVTSKKDWLSS
ncbi:2-oxoglutarate dehydrogenase, mitochondrial-like protein [Tanacetum coccineum]